MATQPRPAMQAAALDPELPDRSGLEVMDEHECWERVREQPLGRLAVTVSGSPHIVPVNHTTRDHEILFVSVPGTKLEATLRQPGVPASFEVDDYDGDAHTGWSVVIRGHLHPILDLVDVASLEIRGRASWLDSRHARNWVRLVPDRIEGRRLTG